MRLFKFFNSLCFLILLVLGYEATTFSLEKSILSEDDKDKIEIITPKENQVLIVDRIFEISWKIMSKDNEKLTKVSIGIENEKEPIKETVEVKYNNKCGYDWLCNKKPGKYKIVIKDLNNDEVISAQQFIVADPIDITSPSILDTCMSGSKMKLSWTFNYDKSSYLDKVYLAFTTNNGNTWQSMDIKTANLISAGKSHTYTLTVPNASSNLVKFRIIDSSDTRNVVTTTSKVFVVKRPNDGKYFLRIGPNFDFFDGVKVSDLYTNIEINKPRMWGFYGLNLSLSRGSAHSDDSSGSKPNDTTTINRSVITDIVNIYMNVTGVLNFRAFKQLNFIAPSLEYRRAIKDIQINNEIIGNDTTIKSQNKHKETIDEWLIGFGLGLRLEEDNFNFTGSATFNYNTSAKRIDPSRDNFWRQLDMIFRYNLMEPYTQLSFGGELKYPLVNSRLSPPELTFYFSRDISLKELFQAILGVQ